MRVFITGATGFAGSHLVRDLLAAGATVFALVHDQSSHVELPAHERFRPLAGDLLDEASLLAALREARPDTVYHLAGQALTAQSWDRPALTLQVNTVGTVNLLEAVIHYGRPRTVVVTSAEIYGVIRPEELPVTEETRPRPHHPYGVSKWAAGQLVSLYQQRYDLPVVEARPFNHIGPRQARGFVVPDFASQLAAIKLGQQEPVMSVGNLSAERDFTDVRDVVRAYQRLAEAGRPGETYIICSGRSVAIEQILMILVELAGVDVTITRDPARMRPSEIPRLYGSYAKLAADTGWQPQVALEQSLADAFAEWMERLGRKDEG